MPLKEKSFKFPIGVATKYNVPFELMIYSPFKILVYSSILLFFLSCSSTTDKNFEEFNLNLPSNVITEKIYREIKSISMNKDFEIIRSENLTKKESIFTQGFLASYYLNNKYSNRQKKVSFISTKEKLSSCKEDNQSAVIHIIFRNSLKENLLKECNFDKSRTYVINLENEDSINDYREISIRNQIFFNKPSILKIIEENKFLFISSKIKEIVERILNRNLQFTSRKRQDINSIILSSNSESTKRILPALKFNLLQDIKIFNMPNHFDAWSNSSTPNDLNSSKGLEYPILVNKMNFGDQEFLKLSSDEKIIYSLGFDTLGIISDKDYFGFLGQYSARNNKIILQPISVDFEGDQIQQRF